MNACEGASNAKLAALIGTPVPRMRPKAVHQKLIPNDWVNVRRARDPNYSASCGGVEGREAVCS
jgi:hypothetical protein